MNNNNTLVALAYVKANENPYKVFCNYILYSLNKALNQQMTWDKLIKSIEDEFGLTMSAHMLRICLKTLEDNGEVTRTDDKREYKLGRTGFNTRDFELDRNALKTSEEHVLRRLEKFLFEYNLEWNRETIRSNLTKFLLKDGNAYNLFMNEETIASHLGGSKKQAG